MAKKQTYARFNKVRKRIENVQEDCMQIWVPSSIILYERRDAFMHSQWCGGCLWGAGNITHCRVDVRSRGRTGSITLFHQTDQSKRISSPFWTVLSVTSLVQVDRLTDPRQWTRIIGTFFVSVENMGCSTSDIPKMISVRGGKVHRNYSTLDRLKYHFCVSCSFQRHNLNMSLSFQRYLHLWLDLIFNAMCLTSGTNLFYRWVMEKLTQRKAAEMGEVKKKNTGESGSCSHSCSYRNPLVSSGSWCIQYIQGFIAAGFFKLTAFTAFSVVRCPC